MENSILIDISDIPNFNAVVGSKGLKSVTEGKVFLSKFPAGVYPACYKHGAILKTSIYGEFWMWRCREYNCDEGCAIKIEK
jgi:hypothetical protein